MITDTDYLKLKAAYEKAVEANQKEFVFKGQTLVTLYAKYVLELLKSNREKKA